jgi:hypothetical protein
MNAAARNQTLRFSTRFVCVQYVRQFTLLHGELLNDDSDEVVELGHGASFCSLFGSLRATTRRCQPAPVEAPADRIEMCITG